MQTEKHEQKGIGQKVVEAPKDRTFQGLHVGQIVMRKIHKGKENRGYLAFAQVFVLKDEEITNVDNRNILIKNEDTIDDSLLEKFGLFKIIQVEKTYYVAYLLAIVREGHEYFKSHFTSL